MRRPRTRHVRIPPFAAAPVSERLTLDARIVLLPETACYYTVVMALNDAGEQTRYAIYARPLAEGPARSGVRVSRWFRALLPAIQALRRLVGYNGIGRAHTFEYAQEPAWARGPFIDRRDGHGSGIARREGPATLAALVALRADLETLDIPTPITVQGRIWPPQRGPHARVPGGAGSGLPGAPASAQPQPQEVTQRDRAVAQQTKEQVGAWWASALTPEERQRGEWIARRWWPELFAPPPVGTLAWSNAVAEVVRLGGPLSVTYDFLDAQGDIVAMDGPILRQVRDE